jgi:Galactose oxidase, central domain
MGRRGTDENLKGTISRRRLLLATGAALGMAAIGCGGGDDDEDEAAPEQASPAATEPPPTTTTPSDGATAAPATATPEPAAPPSLSTLRGTWTQLQPSGGPPPVRRDHALVADTEGAFVYLSGGRVNSRDELGDFWIYDVQADTWTQGPEGPSARFGQSRAFGLDSVVIFGGEGAGFFSDVWAYEPAVAAWRVLEEEGAGPAARYGAGGAFDPATTSLYVTHGFTDQGRFDDTWAFNVSLPGWLEVSPAEGERPLRRCLLRSVFDAGGNRIFLFGGQSNEVPFLGDLWAFDLGGGGWTQIDTPGPSPRQLYSMTLVSEGEALLFGGRTEAGDNNELWLLDLASATWTQLTAEGEAPSPRRGHDATWLTASNSMLLFGGQSVDDLNDLWLLEFS